MADGHLWDTHVRWLEAGEDDGFGDLLRLHHVRVADVVFGAAMSNRELCLDASGTDGADLDAMLAKLGVERLRETHLGEFAGRVDGFACDSLQPGNGRDEEDCPAFLGDEMRSSVVGEEEARPHIGVHQGVVLVG